MTLANATTWTSPASDSCSSRPGKIRWYHLAALGILLAVGTYIRLDGITQNGLWADEFQSLCLATGRGDAIMNIPRGVIVRSPPRVGFAGAPGIGNIWTSLDSTVHPPLYHIVLRIWVDCFGDSDFSIRTLSTVMGMLSIVLLFNALCWMRGPVSALLGATMMTFAPLQIDFCQQARPYTLMTFLCLLLFAVLIRVERNGTSRSKLIFLFLLTFAVAMVHYFAIGTIVGGIVYACVRFRGGDRRVTVIALSVGLLAFALVWGPMFWQTWQISQSWMRAQFTTISPHNSLLLFLLDIPQRMTFGPLPSSNWPLVIAMSIVVYAVPLVRFPNISIWYFWLVGSIAVPLAIDIYSASNSRLVGLDKYVFLAAPGVFGVLSEMISGRLIAVAVCLGVIIFGIARFQSGPRFTLGSTWGIEDHRRQARFLVENASKDDLVILPSDWIINGDVNDAGLTYFIIAHYAGEWKTPVLILTSPIANQTRGQLSQFRRVWVVGDSPSTCARLLPNDRLIDVHGATFLDSVWAIK